MTIFLTVIAVLLCLGLLVATASIVIDWHNTLGDNDVRLSFRTFHKFYDIAPEKYELCWGCIAYYVSSRCWQYINMKTPIDYARYRLWFKKKERHKKTVDRVERTQDYINCVRKDLEKFMGDV